MRLAVLVALAVVASGCGSSNGRAASFRISGEAGVGPLLTLSDVARDSVTADTDPATEQAVVLIQLTPTGQEKFARLTRALARRGAAAKRPFHVVITLDGRVLERPYIDYRRNPDGIPATNGIQLDVRSSEQAKRLAKRLRKG